MKKIYQNLAKIIKHLEILNDVFSQKDNYTNKDDYSFYLDNLKKLTEISRDIGLYNQMYSEYDRQMELADMIEYIFFSRGIFSLISNNKLVEKNIPKFLELLLRFVNLLMLYEIITTDNKMRRAFLNKLKKEIVEIKQEAGFDKLLKWNQWVGLTKEDTKKDAPAKYFDSILPKTAGGLWHEILVYAFILRFNIGYIFPLLLHQKIISRDQKLSPPDFIILTKRTRRYYGIEIGYLKERQLVGFTGPTGIAIIPIDTNNVRISDRCPICKKWIGICPKVIEDFSNPNYKIKRPEIRCLYDCDRYSIAEKIEGKCPYIKFIDYKKIFDDKKLHNHYNCVINKIKKTIIKDIITKHKLKKEDFITIKIIPHDPEDVRTKKIRYLTTDYLYYPELVVLM